MPYVFDYCEAEGYLFRAPTLIARVVCAVAERFGKTWGYGTWQDVVS